MDTRALKELADDFRAHPISRGVSDCEKIGEALFDAATEVDRLRELLRDIKKFDIDNFSLDLPQDIRARIERALIGWSE